MLTAHYSPIAYVPQALAIRVGRALNCSPLVLMYVARFANLWTWVGLGYWALRIAPGFGRPLLLLMLMPMSIFLAASVSADAITNGLAFLLAALAFQAATKQNGEENSFVGWPWVVKFIVCSSALGLTKAAYLPLAGLIFLIPAKRLGGPRRLTLMLAMLAMATTIPVMLWSRQTPGLDIAVPFANPYVSPRLQFQFLSTHPKALLLIPILSAQRDWLLVILSFVGKLGWLNIQLSPFFVIAYLIALLLACRCGIEGPEFPHPWRAIAITAIVATASTEALLLLVDLIWTPVGGLCVDGLQGRYFIPIATALLLLVVAIWGCFPAKFLSPGSEPRRNFNTVLTVVMSCAYTIIMLYFHYYVSLGVGRP